VESLPILSWTIVFLEEVTKALGIIITRLKSPMSFWNSRFVDPAEMELNCNKCWVGMFTCGMVHPRCIQDQEAVLEELRGACQKADVPAGAVGISALGCGGGG
jgi:hypothetical protein